MFAQLLLHAAKRVRAPYCPLNATKGIPASQPLAMQPSGASEWIIVDNFSMERQCHTRWCWTAVAEAVARCYIPSKNLTQRDIAKLLMPRAKFEEPCYRIDDCDLEYDNCLDYNTPNLLMSALLLIDCYGKASPIPDKPAPLQDVQQWIDGDDRGRRAVCVRILWPDGDAHFVTITGYDRGSTLLHVLDPWGPRARNISYYELATHYTSVDTRFADETMEGKWVDTLFTARPVSSKGVRA